jgi:signal transduction histidine kinase
MNSINGYSEMLLMSRYGEVNEKQTDRLERILRNGKSLLALIDDLLDISKIDAGKMELRVESLVVKDELRVAIESLESQATAHGLYLHADVSVDLPLILADSRRLKQILVNLVGNAIKFTKTGGITVEARFGNEQTSPMVYLRVIDTGIGIRTADQAIIFDEFRQVDGSATREYGGTGLGLAITRRLVEMMNGRVWVESEFGRGSAFTVALPVAINGPTSPDPLDTQTAQA